MSDWRNPATVGPAPYVVGESGGRLEFSILGPLVVRSRFRGRAGRRNRALACAVLIVANRVAATVDRRPVGRQRIGRCHVAGLRLAVPQGRRADRLLTFDPAGTEGGRRTGRSRCRGFRILGQRRTGPARGRDSRWRDEAPGPPAGSWRGPALADAEVPTGRRPRREDRGDRPRRDPAVSRRYSPRDYPDVSPPRKPRSPTSAARAVLGALMTAALPQPAAKPKRCGRSTAAAACWARSSASSRAGAHRARGPHGPARGIGPLAAGHHRRPGPARSRRHAHLPAHRPGNLDAPGGRNTMPRCRKRWRAMMDPAGRDRTARRPRREDDRRRNHRGVR